MAVTGSLPSATYSGEEYSMGVAPHEIIMGALFTLVGFAFGRLFGKRGSGVLGAAIFFTIALIAAGLRMVLSTYDEPDTVVQLVRGGSSEFHLEAKLWEKYPTEEAAKCYGSESTGHSKCSMFVVPQYEKGMKVMSEWPPVHIPASTRKLSETDYGMQSCAGAPENQCCLERNTRKGSTTTTDVCETLCGNLRVPRYGHRRMCVPMTRDHPAGGNDDYACICSQAKEYSAEG